MISSVVATLGLHPILTVVIFMGFLHLGHFFILYMSVQSWNISKALAHTPSLKMTNNLRVCSAKVHFQSLFFNTISEYLKLPFKRTYLPFWILLCLLFLSFLPNSMSILSSLSQTTNLPLSITVHPDLPGYLSTTYLENEQYVHTNNIVTASHIWRSTWPEKWSNSLYFMWVILCRRKKNYKWNYETKLCVSSS